MLQLELQGHTVFDEVAAKQNSVVRVLSSGRTIRERCEVHIGCEQCNLVSQRAHPHQPGLFVLRLHQHTHRAAGVAQREGKVAAGALGAEEHLHHTAVQLRFALALVADEELQLVVVQKHLSALPAGGALAHVLVVAVEVPLHDDILLHRAVQAVVHQLLGADHVGLLDHGGHPQPSADVVQRRLVLLRPLLVLAGQRALRPVGAVLPAIFVCILLHNVNILVHHEPT